MSRRCHTEEHDEQAKRLTEQVVRNIARIISRRAAELDMTLERYLATDVLPKLLDDEVATVMMLSAVAEIARQQKGV